MLCLSGFFFIHFDSCVDCIDKFVFLEAHLYVFGIFVSFLMLSKSALEFFDLSLKILIFALLFYEFNLEFTRIGLDHTLALVNNCFVFVIVLHHINVFWLEVEGEIKCFGCVNYVFFFLCRLFGLLGFVIGVLVLQCHVHVFTVIEVAPIIDFA